MSVSIKWHGQKVIESARKSGGRGLQEAADYVLEQSQPAVPVEEGALQASGVASSDAGSLKAAISYGFGETAGYAAPIHEDMSDKHPNGGQAKYLEQPLNSSLLEIARIIGDAIKSGIGA